MNIHETILANKKKVKNCELTFDDDFALAFFSNKGEIVDLTKWELVNDEPVDYEKEDNRAETELSTNYRVMYKYTEVRHSNNSRKFCSSMMSANKEYTKEEIKSFNSNVLNPGLGPNGGSYSIWKYKGGSWCGHAWFRRTYKSIDGGPEESISSAQARREGYKDPSNEPEVSATPYYMPNHASLKHKTKK